MLCIPNSFSISKLVAIRTQLEVYNHPIPHPTFSLQAKSAQLPEIYRWQGRDSEKNAQMTSSRPSILVHFFSKRARMMMCVFYQFIFFSLFSLFFGSFSLLCRVTGDLSLSFPTPAAPSTTIKVCSFMRTGSYAQRWGGRWIFCLRSHKTEANSWLLSERTKLNIIRWRKIHTRRVGLVQCSV